MIVLDNTTTDDEIHLPGLSDFNLENGFLIIYLNLNILSKSK
jgi:hypothetical protein